MNYTKETLIKTVNETGSHFFDADTMEFFNSVLEYVDNSGFFITSEHRDNAKVLLILGIKKPLGVDLMPRFYTLRFFDGQEIVKVSNFEEFESLEEAKQALFSAKTKIIRLVG